MEHYYKYEGFTVGQKIKSMDFENRPERGACFVEGTITEVNRDGTRLVPYAHYVIDVTRDVWDGRDRETGRVGDKAFVPMESTNEWPDRVVPLAN